MSIRNLLIFSSFAAAIWPPVTGSAQQAASSADTNHNAQANQVVLPVTVRDKHGALISNLQKGDLTLTVDGKPQAIATLTHDSGLPYRIGLLVDTSRAMSNVIEAERKAATDFVDLILPAPPLETRDQLFLIHFDREVELLEDFTSSREKLHRELEEMGATRVRESDQGPETTGDDRPRPQGRNVTQLYDAIYLAADELMKNKDGRKILVIFSDGADRGSKETLNDAIDAADHANLSIYTIFVKGTEEREAFPSGGRSGGRYPGGGGGSWPGGGGGRRAPEPTTASGVDGKRIMQQIAARTGGHAYEAKKKDDLDAIYKLIHEELQNQYILTFVPDKSEADSFHKVALTASKSDLAVSTREGYYLPGSDTPR